MNTLYAILILFVSLASDIARSGDLDSWNNGTTRQSILSYIKKANEAGSATFIPKEHRIAVFDNDGTLWSETPVPVQFVFAMERLRTLAPQHPEWKRDATLKAVLENDPKALDHLTEQDIFKIVAATHAGMPLAEFQKTVNDWLKTAKDPKTGLSYPQRVYQPMLELISLLQSHDFKVYIVTGGGVEFVRAFAASAYGIPDEQVIGSSVQMTFRMSGGKPKLMREATPVEPINIREGKPLNIQRIIGKVPVIAVGNSDVDLQMLQYTAASPYPSLALLLHHDDAKREAAYEKGAVKVLQEAKANQWLIISMKDDFNRIYPQPERPSSAG